MKPAQGVTAARPAMEPMHKPRPGRPWCTQSTISHLRSDLSTPHFFIKKTTHTHTHTHTPHTKKRRNSAWRTKGTSDIFWEPYQKQPWKFPKQKTNTQKPNPSNGANSQKPGKQNTKKNTPGSRAAWISFGRGAGRAPLRRRSPCSRRPPRRRRRRRRRPRGPSPR